MTPDDLLRTSDLLFKFVGPLQKKPVEGEPKHLKDTRGFIEYKPEDDLVEITIFTRAKFATLVYDDDRQVDRPKIRYDFEMSYDDFFNADHDILRELLLDHVFNTDKYSLLEIEGVVTVKPLYDIKVEMSEAYKRLT